MTPVGGVGAHRLPEKMITIIQILENEWGLLLMINQTTQQYVNVNSFVL